MAQLVDDYEVNKPLIEILAVSIERWEDQAAEFSDFNAAVAETDRGIAVLKTLMGRCASCILRKPPAVFAIFWVFMERMVT